MGKQECLVCGAENSEGQIKCTRCHWPISADSPEQEILNWAQKIWEFYLKSQRELKKQNSNYGNLHTSALENSLQSLVSHQESQIKLLQEQNIYLKKLSSEVTCIKEQLPSNYSAFKQAQNQESVSTGEDLDSQLSEENNKNKNILESEIIQVNDTSEARIIVENYNQPIEFPDKLEVSETENSKYQRRTGNKSSAIFERSKRGQYWVINNSYLVPNPNEKINEFNYETVSIFFECINYEKRSTDNFTLIQPAKVTCLNTEEKWQFEERGIIEFL